MALFEQLHMVTPLVQSYIEPVGDPLCIWPSVFIPTGAWFCHCVVLVAEWYRVVCCICMFGFAMVFCLLLGCI